MAIRDFNATTTLTSGPVAFREVSEGCSLESGLTEFNTVSKQYPLTASFGPFCSTSQAGALTLANVNRIPMLVPNHIPNEMGGINATRISPPSVDATDYLFSLRSSPVTEARAIAMTCLALNFTTVTAIYFPGLCGDAEAQAFLVSGPRFGINVNGYPMEGPVSAEQIQVSLVGRPPSGKNWVLFSCGVQLQSLWTGIHSGKFISYGYRFLMSPVGTRTVQISDRDGELRTTSSGYFGVTELLNSTVAIPFASAFQTEHGHQPDSNSYYMYEAMTFLLQSLKEAEVAGYTLDGSAASQAGLAEAIWEHETSEGSTLVNFNKHRVRDSATFGAYNVLNTGDVLLGVLNTANAMSYRLINSTLALPFFKQPLTVAVVTYDTSTAWYPGTYHMVVKYLFDRFNDAGIISDKQIIWDYAPSKGTSVGGFDAIQGIISSNPDVFAVLGGNSETDTNPIVPFSNRYIFPIICGAVANQDYLDQTRFPYLSRTGASPTSEIRAILSFIQSQGWRKIGWVYSLRAYSNQQYLLALALAPQYNITIAASASVGDNAILTPATDELMELKKKDVRIIVCATVLSPVVRWFKAAAELDMLGAGYQWVLNGWAMNTVAAALTPGYGWDNLVLNATNVIGVTYYYDETSGAGLDAKQLYANQSGKPFADLHWGSGSQATVFDWVDNANFFLEAFTQWSNARAKEDDFGLYVRNAEITETATGKLPIELDPLTGDRKAVWFALGQYDHLVYRKIGNVKPDGLELSDTIHWMGGVTSAPIDAEPLIPFERSTAIAAVTTVLVVLVLICLAVLGVILFKFRDVPHFRGSTPSFDAIILIGASLAALSSLVYVQDPNDDSDCTFRMWAIGIAGPLTYAPLFVKTYRIERIFSVTQLQTLRITDGQLLQGFVGLMCLPAAILIVASIESSQRSYITQVLDPTGKYLISECSNSQLYLYGMIIFAALLCAWGAKTAWGVRSVPDNFNESFNTAICLVFLVCYLCLIVPLQLLMSSDPNSVALLRSIGILLGIAMSIAVLFVPKVLRLLPGRHKNIMTFTAAPREETGLRYSGNRDSPKGQPRQGSRPGANGSSGDAQPGAAYRQPNLPGVPTPTNATQQRGSTASLLNSAQMTATVSPLNSVAPPPQAQTAWIAPTPPSMERGMSQPIQEKNSGSSTSTGTPVMGSARRTGALAAHVDNGTGSNGSGVEGQPSSVQLGRVI